MPQKEPVVSARCSPASDRRGRIVSVRLGATGLALVFAFGLGMMPAHACSALDPCVAETVDQADETVSDTVPGEVEEPVETVEGTVEETVGTVEETVGAVEEAATGVVDEVEEIVNGVLGGGGTTEPDPEPRGGGPAETTVQDPAGSAGGQAGSRPAQSSGAAHPDVVEHPSGPSAILHDPAASVVASLTAPAPELGPATSSQPMERWGGLLDLPAPVLAFPVVLAIVVLVFVAVQNRLDRRDPRLALASMLPEVVRFD